jgi:hypothetical protein
MVQRGVIAANKIIGGGGEHEDPTDLAHPRCWVIGGPLMILIELNVSSIPCDQLLNGIT